MPVSTDPSAMSPYVRRAVRVIDRIELEGLRLKVYSITSVGERAGEGLIRAGIARAAEHLRDHPTRQQRAGLGFIGVHDGRGENQVFLDLWINENELTHDYWISSKHAPEALAAPGPDHNSVCVWDLFVQAFERENWLRYVLDNPSGPDLEAYWRAGFDGRV